LWRLADLRGDLQPHRTFFLRPFPNRKLIDHKSRPDCFSIRVFSISKSLHGGSFRRKRSMTKGKRRARRLALYLGSIGISLVPPTSSYKQWAVDLQNQYNALGVEQRKLARRNGRRLVKKMGSAQLATAFLPPPIFLLPQTARSLSVAPISRSRKEYFKHISKNWSALTPPCPSFRMGNRFPKRSWPTQDWGKEVWRRQHDRDSLRVYACPVQQGYWHLGHIRRSNTSVFRPDEISIKPINLEIFHSNQKES